MIVSALGVAFFTSLLLLPLTRRLAFRLGALDRPGGRKRHREPVPCLGGLAVVGGVTAALAAGLLLPTGGIGGPVIFGWTGLALALCVGTLAVVGTLDDLRPVPPRWKLALEGLVALGAAVFILDARSLDVAGVGIGDPLGIIAVLVATFWIVSIINAYNMVDGLDGLAGGVGAVAAGAFAVIALLQGQVSAGILALALAGALLAFLLFNLPPARVFLGDSGSLPVGFLLAVLGVEALTDPAGVWSVVPALVILGVPAMDLTFAVARRFLRSLELVREEKVRERFQVHMVHAPALFAPDRGHLHHRIGSLTQGPRRTLTCLVALGVLFGAAGVTAAVAGHQGALLGLALLLAVGAVLVRQLFPEMDLVQRGLLLALFDIAPVRSRKVHGLHDFLAGTGAFLVAAWLIRLGNPAQAVPVSPASALLAGGVTVWTLYVSGLYRAHFRRVGLWQAVRTAGLALIAGAVALPVVMAAGGTRPTPAFAVLYLYLLATAILASRVSFRVLDTWHQRATNGGRKTVIYGAGRGGDMVLRKLLSTPDLAMNPVAFLDDDPGLQGREVEGYPVLDPANGLHTMRKGLEALDLVVSSEKIPDEKVERLVQRVREEGTDLRVLRFRWSPEGESVEDEAPQEPPVPLLLTSRESA